MQKGAATITDSLFAVIGVAIFVYAMYAIVGQQLSDLGKEFAQDSAEVVARDLAGFIAISAAAPDQVDIIYKPSQTFSYDIEADKRIVAVAVLLSGEFAGGTSIFGEKITGPLSWKEKTTVDLTTPAHFKNAQLFLIQKIVEGGKYVYKLTKG